MPALPIAATTDRPGKGPGGAGRRLFANMKVRGQQPGWLAGDLLYTNLVAADFQNPARDEGYDLVLGYGVNQIGKQYAHESGATLVEGRYYAPCMPEGLANATKDLRDVKITLKEYGRRIQQRVMYEMRTKQNGKNGLNERLQCPAAGAHPTVRCPLKPRSMQERPTLNRQHGIVDDFRKTIQHAGALLTNCTAPEVCHKETITIHRGEKDAKYRQSRRFGSPEQIRLYNLLRQSQEGVHGSAKDEARTALANAGRRRVRGWAAQQVFAAFLFAQTATNRIIAFLRDAVPDENGDLYVPRVKRAGRHATTHNPPGAATVEEGPPVLDEPPEPQ